MIFGRQGWVNLKYRKLFVRKTCDGIYAQILKAHEAQTKKSDLTKKENLAKLLFTY